MDNNDKYIIINDISINITYFKPSVYSTRRHRVNNIVYEKNNNYNDEDECIENMRRSTQPRKLVHYNRNKTIF
jgi:hypothetical protein